MNAYKLVSLTAILFVVGLTLTACSTTRESSAYDKVHHQKILNVLERADTRMSRQ